MCNIREAHIEDAENVINYIIKVSDETDYMLSDSKERELEVKKRRNSYKIYKKALLPRCLYTRKMEK